MKELEELGPRKTAANQAEYNSLTRALGYADSEDFLINAQHQKVVPDAPLKKTWYETAFRRVLRMAAEEGYDSVAWTPGEVQADRYDLSKQISEIHLSGTNFKAYDLDGNTVIEQTGVKADDLPELIGNRGRRSVAGTKAGTRFAFTYW